MTNSDNNKRIAKNTLLLYFRMIVMALIGLFTSRIVLDALGAVDFGIYNVVGGIIVLLSFLNAALTSATQRFLNFFMGKGDEKKVAMVFSMSVNLYLVLSIIIIILGETIGLWFLNNCLNIPPERMMAARWVYQLTILQFVVNMLRIPYNASIIAYERMNFYAYISLIDVLAKLAVCYLLYITIFDRLITYAIFYTLIPIIISFAFKIYCNRHFPTTHYHRVWDKSLFKEITSYSGWEFLNGVANIFSTQGLNIILNIFHGVTLNAASGIAGQVSGHVNGFVTNFQIAFQPQIVKNYAANQTNDFHSLIFRSSKFSYFLILVFLIPLMFTLDKILDIWLVDVPKYTLEICKLILVYQAIDAIKMPFVFGVNATGKIKTYKIVTSTSKLMNIPLAWIVLAMGMVPWSIWCVRIIINILEFIYLIIYDKRNLKISIISGLKNVFIPAAIVTLLAIPIPFILLHLIDGFWPNLLVVGIVSLTLTIALICFIGLSQNERNAMKKIILSKIKRK